MWSFQVCAFVWLQGTIFSKTAMENYKEFGPSLFKMSVPFSPAKRLGVPEEVCNHVVIYLVKLREALLTMHYTVLGSNTYAELFENISCLWDFQVCIHTSKVRAIPY